MRPKSTTIAILILIIFLCLFTNEVIEYEKKPFAFKKILPSLFKQEEEERYDFYFRSVVNYSRPLNFSCNDCAFVTSAGYLLDSRKGAEIDNHDCVIRTNDSPTKNYRDDVGIKTTVRILGFQGQNEFETRLKNNEIDEGEQNGTFIVAWGPPRLIGIDKPFTKRLQRWQMEYPDMEFFEFINLSWVYKFYSNMVKKKVNPDLIWISTGFMGVLLARQFCQSTNIYGMAEKSYCNTLSSTANDKPYHYYSTAKDSLKECAHVQRQANSKNGGHNFQTERRLIEQLAREDNNIFFKFPEQA